MTSEEIMLARVPQRLHDSEINFALSCFYDGEWKVKLGDELNGFKEEAIVTSHNEALKWLDKKALEYYPTSLYATGKYPKGWRFDGDTSAVG